MGTQVGGSGGSALSTSKNLVVTVRTMCVYVYVCMYVCVYMYLYVYMYVYVCMYVCVHMYLYVYMYVYVCMCGVWVGQNGSLHSSYTV